MPLKINIKNSEPVYNNPEFYDDWKGLVVPAEACACYQYTRFNGQPVTVCKPRIDTLQLTLQLEGLSARQSLIKNLNEFVSNEDEDETSTFYMSKYGHYARTHLIKDFPSPVWIRTRAVGSETGRFAQLQLHASRFTAHDIKTLFLRLEQLSSGSWSPEYIWRHSKTIRLDWCTDFIGISPAEMGLWKGNTPNNRGLQK